MPVSPAAVSVHPSSLSFYLLSLYKRQASGKKVLWFILFRVESIFARRFVWCSNIITVWQQFCLYDNIKFEQSAAMMTVVSFGGITPQTADFWSLKLLFFSPLDESNRLAEAVKIPGDDYKGKAESGAGWRENRPPRSHSRKASGSAIN